MFVNIFICVLVFSLFDAMTFE